MSSLLAVEGRKRAPKGHFVVYVGEEHKRFVVPLSVLKNPIFQQLLNNAADEYGFDAHKGIVLPCDESTFQSFLHMILRPNDS